MPKIVDARGLNCPQPVILTKKAIEDSGEQEIVTIVDNTVALENVKRLAQGQGYQVRVEESGEEHHIHMTRTKQINECQLEKCEQVTILITGNLFGKGDQKLGGVLMESFLFALTEVQASVTTLILMNSGVYLTTEGSPVREHLLELEKQGCEIMSCGTCLDYYGLKEKLVVGKVTNMYTATEMLLNADKSLVL